MLRTWAKICAGGAVAVLALAGCDPSETLARYGGRNFQWHLAEIDGVAVPFSATLIFGFHGTVLGDGPCGPYAAELLVPYPWFELEAIEHTQPGCAQSASQQAYLDALRVMTLAEVSGASLVLSNDAHREMVFTGVPFGG